MMHDKTGFIKGMSVGIVAGAALGMIAAPRGKQKKSAVGRALKAAGDIVDNISGLWN